MGWRSASCCLSTATSALVMLSLSRPVESVFCRFVSVSPRVWSTDLRSRRVEISRPFDGDQAEIGWQSARRIIEMSSRYDVGVT